MRSAAALVLLPCLVVLVAGQGPSKSSVAFYGRGSAASAGAGAGAESGGGVEASGAGAAAGQKHGNRTHNRSSAALEAHHHSWPPKPEGVETDPQDDGDETAADSYFLAAGCHEALKRHGEERPPFGFFELGSKAVGKVQCCSPTAEPTYCVRAVSSLCLGGDDTDRLYTFDEAQKVCEDSSFRLCTREELARQDSSGCCDKDEDVCNLDHALVWTSDHRKQSENANLWSFIEDLVKANEQLRGEALLRRQKSRALKAMYERFTVHPVHRVELDPALRDPAVAQLDAENEASMKLMDEFDRNFTKATRSWSQMSAASPAGA